MDRDLVVLERLGSVGHVLLDRPEKLNAADARLQGDFNRVLREAGAADGVEAIVVSGRGRALSSGGDRSVLEQVVHDGGSSFGGSLAAMTDERIRLMLEEIRQPIVVAVQGFAIGWGAELVALADFVVMEDDAYLQEPHALHGLAPAPGCELVWSRHLPGPVLKEILALGRRVSAAEAYRWGLVNWVVPVGTAGAVALAFAARLAGQPSAGVAAVRRSVNRQALADHTRLSPR